MASDLNLPDADDRNERYHPENPPDRRTDAERDRDRVLYSSEFARLAEITQVISPERGYVFHNRLTHSLKVAQIARRIAQKIVAETGNDAGQFSDLPDIAESAALAHDLGHPPFGHAAETELDKLVRDAGLEDGFEGNAQSFRIVTRLAASDALTIQNPGTEDEYEEPAPGFNWTRQCLDALLKYPWGHGDNAKNKGKWGFYESEREIFSWIRKRKPDIQRSLGAEIIDWADDITYAIHDLLDFFRAGSIPIERLRRGMSVEYLDFMNGVFRRKPEWQESEEEFKNALAEIVAGFPFTSDRRFTDSLDHRTLLHQFATNLIRPFVDAIAYKPNSAATEVTVCIDPHRRRQVDLLKQFTWHYIIEKPELALPQAGQRKAIRTVFRKLLLAARKRDMRLFPNAIRDGFSNLVLERIMNQNALHGEVRVVADYVAGMTEKELIRVYRSLEGA